MTKDRFEISAKNGKKIVHHVWSNDYDEAMELLDLMEENWPYCKIEFTDHKLFTGKYK